MSIPPMPTFGPLRSAALLLLAGFAFTYTVAEPFPTPVMPGFGTVLSTGDTTTLTIPICLAIGNDGKAERLPVDSVFRPMSQYVSPVPMLRRLCNPASPMTPSNASGLYAKLRQMRQTIRAAVLGNQSPPLTARDSAEVSRWLLSAARSLRPHSEIVAVELQLRQQRYVVGHGVLPVPPDTVHSFRTSPPQDAIPTGNNTP